MKLYPTIKTADVRKHSYQVVSKPGKTHMPVIPALGRLTQKHGCELELSLVYTESSRTAVPHSKILSQKKIATKALDIDIL